MQSVHQLQFFIPTLIDSKHVTTTLTTTFGPIRYNEV